MMAILLWWFFRRPVAVVAPMVAITVSVVCTAGVIGLAGDDINQITIIYPVLLMGVVVATATHLLHRFYRERAAGADAETAARVTLERISRAAIVCTVTNAIGFISLTMARMQILHEFGLYLAAGVVFCFVTTSLAIPALLVLRDSRPPARYLREWGPDRSSGTAYSTLTARFAGSATGPTSAADRAGRRAGRRVPVGGDRAHAGVRLLAVGDAQRRPAHECRQPDHRPRAVRHRPDRDQREKASTGTFTDFQNVEAIRGYVWPWFGCILFSRGSRGVGAGEAAQRPPRLDAQRGRAAGPRRSRRRAGARRPRRRAAQDGSEARHIRSQVAQQPRPVGARARRHASSAARDALPVGRQVERSSRPRSGSA